MSLDRDIEILSNVEILSDLSVDELRLLAFGCEQLNYAAGRTVFREGQHADCGYVIVSGRVELSRSIDGEQKAMHTVGPNQVLGEMALITPTDRLTTATALEDTSTLRLNRTLIHRVLGEYPETAAALHARLSDRLADFLKDIGRLDYRFSR